MSKEPVVHDFWNAHQQKRRIERMLPIWARRQSMKENGIAQEHASLLQDLATLEGCLAEGGPDIQADEQLRALELRLRSHMSREEEGGWMQEVLEHAPHLAREVRRLREEHSQLKTGFSDLVQRARRIAEVWQDDRFRARMKGWIHAMRAHEMRESALLQEAYLRDIGAQD